MRTKTRQREFGFTNWGGKRRGAGRKPKGEHAGVSHAKRPKLCARHPVLVTLRLRDGLPNLRYDDTHALVKSACESSSEHESFRVVEYSVQTNHLHLIVEANGELALSRGMNGLVSRIARAFNKLWKRSGRVFADRYHARTLETPREVRNALVYVLHNARKHGSWSARRADPYSSGTSFEGWKHASDEVAVSSPRSLPRARTWLLAVGWRRHGLIDAREVPVVQSVSKRRTSTARGRRARTLAG